MILSSYSVIDLRSYFANLVPPTTPRCSGLHFHQPQPAWLHQDEEGCLRWLVFQWDHDALTLCDHREQIYYTVLRCIPSPRGILEIVVLQKGVSNQLLNTKLLFFV